MNSGSSVFSFGKVLSSISKTLGVANQVIPLYQQTKPILKNAKTAYDLIRGITKSPEKKVEKEIINVPVLNEKRAIQSNSPQFFI